jgi:hypothetical protein
MDADALLVVVVDHDEREVRWRIQLLPFSATSALVNSKLVILLVFRLPRFLQESLEPFTSGMAPA